MHFFCPDFLDQFNENVVSDHRLRGSGYPLSVDSENYADLDFLTSATTNTSVIGGQTITKKMSFFGRFNYNYLSLSKYLLQFSVRHDGASPDILPPQNRWETFPVFSVGWVLSEENFFPETVKDYMKIRGG